MRHTRAGMLVGIANPWWRGKRARYSRCMCNPQFYVSDKRPSLLRLRCIIRFQHIKWYVTVRSLFSNRRTELSLTHWGLVTDICVRKSGDGLSRSTPNHYLDQWCCIFHWILLNKFQGTLIFCQEDAFENLAKKFDQCIQSSMCWING